jgi:hypothetical protein
VLAGTVVLLVVSGASAVLIPSTAAGVTAGAMPPLVVAGWSRTSDAAAWVTAADGKTQSLDLGYWRGTQQLQMRVVQTLADDAKLPALRSIAGSSGGPWHEARTEALRRCEGERCADFLHVSLQARSSRGQRHVYAAYCADALITDSTLALRATHAWHRLTGQAGDWRAVALAVDGDGLTPDEVARLLRALQPASGSDAAPV